MHTVNVLVDQTGNITVLDWSAAVIAPRAYDCGFTSLMLAEPPLVVPGWLRPVLRRAGRWLSRRFLRAYESQAGVRVAPDVLAWFQALICVRALSEIANWAVAGDLANRAGHPWVINQAALGKRLLKITGIAAPMETVS